MLAVRPRTLVFSVGIFLILLGLYTLFLSLEPERESLTAQQQSESQLAQEVKFRLRTEYMAELREPYTRVQADGLLTTHATSAQDLSALPNTTKSFLQAAVDPGHWPVRLLWIGGAFLLLMAAMGFLQFKMDRTPFSALGKWRRFIARSSRPLLGTLGVCLLLIFVTPITQMLLTGIFYLLYFEISDASHLLVAACILLCCIPVAKQFGVKTTVFVLLVAIGCMSIIFQITFNGLFHSADSGRFPHNAFLLLCAGFLITLMSTLWNAKSLNKSWMNTMSFAFKGIGALLILLVGQYYKNFEARDKAKTQLESAQTKNKEAVSAFVEAFDQDLTPARRDMMLNHMLTDMHSEQYQSLHAFQVLHGLAGKDYGTSLDTSTDATIDKEFITRIRQILLPYLYQGEVYHDALYPKPANANDYELSETILYAQALEYCFRHYPIYHTSLPKLQKALSMLSSEQRQRCAQYNAQNNHQVAHLLTDYLRTRREGHLWERRDESWWMGNNDIIRLTLENNLGLVQEGNSIKLPHTKIPYSEKHEKQLYESYITQIQELVIELYALTHQDRFTQSDGLIAHLATQIEESFHAATYELEAPVADVASPLVMKSGVLLNEVQMLAPARVTPPVRQLTSAERSSLEKVFAQATDRITTGTARPVLHIYVAASEESEKSSLTDQKEAYMRALKDTLHPALQQAVNYHPYEAIYLHFRQSDYIRFGNSQLRITNGVADQTDLTLTTEQQGAVQAQAQQILAQLRGEGAGNAFQTYTDASGFKPDLHFYEASPDSALSTSGYIFHQYELRLNVQDSKTLKDWLAAHVPAQGAPEAEPDTELE